MTTIRGQIDHIRFRAETTGFTVACVIVDGEEKDCVGIMPDIRPGETYEFTGDFVVHDYYGEQLTVTDYTEVRPTDAEGAERYLASGAVRGIRAGLAKRIVERFGDDTFRIMEEEPERLAEVKGISMKKAMEISDDINQRRDLREAAVFLQKYGLSLHMAGKVYAAYGKEIYSVLKTNPYRLAEDITGIGFRIADDIAHRVGIRVDSEYRICSGILHVLSEAAQEGHTCLPREELLTRSVQLLRVEAAAVEKCVEDLCAARKLTLQHTANREPMLYHPAYYRAELNTAVLLEKLNIRFSIPTEEIQRKLSGIEEDLGVTLAPAQKEAVEIAVNNGVCLMTGGPGTGKTTTIHAILRYFELEGLQIFLAAPTGRAAKRMTEMTGFPARTIHRLLEVNGGAEEETSYFDRNESNPLEADVVIVDEMSMVDITLMAALLKAMTVGMRLVLVGDMNQLPSVGPGAVLKDLILSKVFPVSFLSTIFRQEEGSDIVLTAHAILEGRPVLPDNKSKDIFFQKYYDAEWIIPSVVMLVKKSLPSYVQADSAEIQVLTPTRKGLLGVSRLNEILQAQLNPPEPSKKEVQRGDRIFREGDKVMQIRNNYKREWEIRNQHHFLQDSGAGVFNGDLGRVKRVDAFNHLMTVEFDESRCVDYDYKELDELELAYAMTIHKSQGSEYPAIVIPLLEGPRMLLNRNLLYTAVTRAKKCVVMVGDEKVFYRMVENAEEQKRYTGLKERLLEIENRPR